MKCSIRNLCVLMGWLVVSGLLAGCGGGRESQLEATVAALQTQVIEAATAEPPTDTPTAAAPTATVRPTNTPQPTATSKPPTATATANTMVEMKVYRNEKAGFAVSYPAEAKVEELKSGGIKAAWDDGWLVVMAPDFTQDELSKLADNADAERLFAGSVLVASECTDPILQVDTEKEVLGGKGWLLQGVCGTPAGAVFKSMAVLEGAKSFWLTVRFPKDEEKTAQALVDSFERIEPPLPRTYVRVSSASANLRGGPGTNYPTVGSAKQGAVLEVVGKNEKGDWWQVKRGDGVAWIAGSVATPGGDVGAVAVAKNIPTPPPPPPTATAAPARAASTTAPTQGLTIGSQVEANGWTFKVYDVKRRKVVYFYDDSYVAQGNFVLVFVEATNHLSGTSYFAKDLKPWLTDKRGGRNLGSSTGSSYAQWQLGGMDSFYTDVNPGQTVRMLEAYDVPEGVGEVLLSLAPPAWIALGNADVIPVEP